MALINVEMLRRTWYAKAMEFLHIYLFKFKLIGKYSFGISFDTYNTKFVPENTPCLLLAISRH